MAGKYGYKRPRPWNKLQRGLYMIVDPTINFQIHCAVYSTGPNYKIPRYWITLGKEIIFDYPKQYMDSWFMFPSNGLVSDISDLIREYIDTPLSELMNKHFENDLWGLADIFRAADRRIGQRRLSQMQKATKEPIVQKILALRIKSPKKQIDLMA